MTGRHCGEAPPDSRRNPQALRASPAARSRMSTRIGRRKHAVRRPSRGRRIFGGRDRHDSRRLARRPVSRARSRTSSPAPCTKVVQPGPLGKRGQVRRRRCAPLPSASVRLQLGTPIWSATMRSSSRSAASRLIVGRKFLPRKPYTQLVRSTSACAPAAAIARSPSSLLVRRHSTARSAHPPDTASSRIPSNT